ncbi:hypothetical protein [Gordonia sp. ABSL49_1]|uniref:hypothetical protein n=1 Tax=Gordonia sp. ABSL49_1 TaxID=2920941 RepID=UPI001F0EC3DE|nr:hypothetical protein [Gordonia sp. ABSL49_1]MCH5642088.1 hypothetical protein [Gordonia sp. ABSL49_1]
MGNRHSARSHSTRRSRLWLAGALPRIHDELGEAYFALAYEYLQYLHILEQRLFDLEFEIEDLEDSGSGPGDSEFDRAVQKHADDEDLQRLLSGTFVHALRAVDVLKDLAPVWVPAAVNDVLASLEVDADDARGLAQVGATGMVVFDKSPMRMREVLPSGPQMPEVDVDGVLWWTKRAATDVVPARLVLAPLTRSRDLQWLRGDGWKPSTLTEVTCFDVTASAEAGVDANLLPCVALLAKIGLAQQHNAIRVVDGSMRISHAA